MVFRTKEHDMQFTLGDVDKKADTLFIESYETHPFGAEIVMEITTTFDQASKTLTASDAREVAAALAQAADEIEQRA